MFPVSRGDEMRFTAEELEPARRRLADALERDWGGAGTPAQRLAAAWQRIGELRLPGVVAPQSVLGEVERLVNLWDHHRPGGPLKAAHALTPEQVNAEVDVIRTMLDQVDEASR
jgi:hypothetical protein